MCGVPYDFRRAVSDRAFGTGRVSSGAPGHVHEEVLSAAATGGYSAFPAPSRRAEALAAQDHLYTVETLASSGGTTVVARSALPVRACNRAGLEARWPADTLTS